LATLLTQMIAASGFLDALTWRLYSNPANITPATALADLTEAVFQGYAPVVGSAWGTPFVDAGGNGVVIGGNAQFRATGMTGAQNIFGYYATRGASVSEVLVFVEPFQQQIPIAKLDDAIVVQQSYGLPGPFSANTTVS
jgi:hypothetical protein